MAISLNALELIGIFLFGVIGVITIEGVSGIESPRSTNQLLELLNLKTSTLQTQVTTIAGIALAFLIARSAISLLYFRRLNFFMARKSANVSTRFFKRLMSSTLDIFEKRSVQHWYLGLTKGVNALFVKIPSAFVSILVDVFLLAFIVIALLVFDPIVGILSVTFMLLVAMLFFVSSGRRVIKLAEREFSLEGSSSQDFIDLLDGFKEYTRNALVNHRIDLIGSSWIKQSDMTARLALIPILSKYLFEGAILIGIFVFSATMFLLFDATVAFGGIAAFLVASTRIMPGLARIQSNLNVINSAFASVRSLNNISNDFETFSKTFSIVDEESSFHLVAAGCLEIENLVYKNSNISLYCNFVQFAQGEKIALVGPSGIGKTTFLDIISGTRMANSGSVRYCSIPVWKIRGTIPSALVYLPQKPALLRGSLKENLFIGQQDGANLSARSVLQALNLWGLFEYKGALDADLSSSYKNLSGGEKQRLSLTRAILQRPRVLILDEFTSSLDTENAKLAIKAIFEFLPDTTVIASMHNEELLNEFDKVISINKGEINRVRL